MMVAKCPVPGCKTVIRLTRIMCIKHWQIVPKALQDAVWRTARANNRTMHRAAAKAAIEFVSQAEKPAVAVPV